MSLLTSWLLIKGLGHVLKAHTHMHTCTQTHPDTLLTTFCYDIKSSNILISLMFFIFVTFLLSICFIFSFPHIFYNCPIWKKNDQTFFFFLIVFWRYVNVKIWDDLQILASIKSIKSNFPINGACLINLIFFISAYQVCHVTYLPLIHTDLHTLTLLLHYYEIWSMDRNTFISIKSLKWADHGKCQVSAAHWVGHTHTQTRMHARTHIHVMCTNTDVQVYSCECMCTHIFTSTHIHITQVSS